MAEAACCKRVVVSDLAGFGVRPAAAGCRFLSSEACFRRALEQARAAKAVPQGGAALQSASRQQYFAGESPGNTQYLSRVRGAVKQLLAHGAVLRHALYTFSLHFPRAAAPGALDLASAITFRAVLSSYHQHDLHALALAPRARNRPIAVAPWAFNHFSHTPFHTWHVPDVGTVSRRPESKVRSLLRKPLSASFRILKVGETRVLDRTS